MYYLNFVTACNCFDGKHTVKTVNDNYICSGVFSTGATGAIAPVILRKRLIEPAVSTRNGKILLTLSTLNIKILNTPLITVHNFGAP